MTSPYDRLKALGGHLWSYRNSITWLLIITALAAFAALPLTAQKGYMDEKALVVGAMGLSIHEIQGADSIYNELKKETDLHDIYRMLNRASELAIKYNPSLPPAPVWHRQNKNNTSSACRAAHALIPSDRGDGTEALLLALPITPGLDTAALTIAIGIQAARHLSSVPWLAKDLAIVFLEVEGSNTDNTRSHCTYSALDSLESWLKNMDLEGATEENAKEEKIQPGHHYQNSFGLIQQGIILDIHSVASTEARLSVHGYNGQLPNLDLVVLTKKNLDFYTNLPNGVGVDIGGAPAVKTRNDINTLYQRIRTLASFTRYLVMGKPTGAHAALLQRGADALSITFTRPDLTKNKKASSSFGGSDTLVDPSSRIRDSDVILTARNALNAIEMILRTCNNLHERLHHANALYILIDADHFVNVGACMALPGILLAALVLLVAEYVPRMSIEREKEKKGAVLAVVLHSMGILTTTAVVISQHFLKYNSQKEFDNIKSLHRIPYFINFTALFSENSSRLLQLLSTAVAAVLIFLQIGGRWTHLLFHHSYSKNACTTTSTPKTSSTKESGSVFSACIGVFSVLLLIEAAALLLWRWALCFVLLASTVPVLQLISQTCL